jgi:probable HAF family extracellular repeat protein
MFHQISFYIFTRILLPVLSVGVFALPSSAQTMTMLPPFTSEGYISYPSAVSGDGNVIAGTASSYQSIRAAKWMRNSGTQSYEISGFVGVNNYAEATSVSHDGSVVVGENGFAGSFRWTASGGTQNLGSMPTGWQSAARGVSGDGLVVVGGGNIVDEYNQGWNRAYRWSSITGMQSIGTLTQGSNSNALGVNFDGSVIVGESSNQAFRWTSGSGMIGLGFLAGQSSSLASAVNGDGSMIIGHSGQSGFQWTSTGGMQSLTGDYNGSYRPRALTADGSIIVGALGYQSNWTAMIWANSNTAITLSEYLSAHSVSLAGWSSLSDARGISADGRYIVGYGVYEGQQRGFVADIGVIPAPGAIALLGMAGIFGTRRRR